MGGSLFQLAKRDAKFFVTQGGFEEDIILTSPSRDKEVSLTGFATKHWINFDSDGNPVNSKNVHVCIDESVLIANNYQTRNIKGEISLLNHFVSFADSSDTIRNYTVRECFPDETLGLIVLILKDFKI